MGKELLFDRDDSSFTGEQVASYVLVLELSKKLCYIFQATRSANGLSEPLDILETNDLLKWDAAA